MEIYWPPPDRLRMVTGEGLHLFDFTDTDGSKLITTESGTCVLCPMSCAVAERCPQKVSIEFSGGVDYDHGVNTR